MTSGAGTKKDSSYCIEKPFNPRLTAIDALRGLAVILMLMQHIIYWLCSHLHSSNCIRVLGGLGGLAAPLFIVLAGAGVTLAVRRHENIDKLLIGRGAMIMGFGYLLNLLTPNWFSPHSWYVLHMIGFAMILAPLFRQVPDWVLYALLTAAIAGTVLIQNSLDTPFYLQNWHMASTSLPGGVFRLILAEGFFPVFPWIAFFFEGLLCGRLLVRRKSGLLWRPVVVFLTISGLLSAVYLAGVDFALHAPWVRVFKPLPNFYPALVPVTFVLLGLALLLMLIFLLLEKHITSGLIHGSLNFLTYPGRCSLSILIIHIPLIREPVVRLGYWRSLSIPETLAATLVLILFFSAAALWWGKTGYRYGSEWLLRKVFP